MEHSIQCFESQWIAQFWAPDAVLFDPAFRNKEFLNYLSSYNIEARPIPPRRHNKNVLESNHRSIRDIFLRLKADLEHTDEDLLVYQAFRISNDLYGSDVTSSQELAKGYTRPIQKDCEPIPIPDAIQAAHDQLAAKRKLNLILRSKAVNEPTISVGDLVQVFTKQQHEKRGSWSAPKPDISYDHASKTVTVPGSSGRQIRAAIEDTLHAITENALAQDIQSAIDVLDTSLGLAMDDCCEDTREPDPDYDIACNDNCSTDADFELDDSATATIATTDDTTMPNIGDNIEVYWPLEHTYYPGTIASVTDGVYNIQYDDVDVENLDLSNETWKFSDNDNSRTLTSNEVLLSQGQDLPSVEKEAIDLYHEVFGYKDFMLFEAQGLPSYVTENAYKKEEESFMKTVRRVPLDNVPPSANIITSHVLYKVKKCDDGARIMKARIAPHGSKDRERSNLKTDSATCPPVGVRLLLSLAVIFKWTLAKIDFKSAFLQTGAAKRNVYVVPPRETQDRSCYWLLLTADYGLVNANAKWQAQSDMFLHDIGFSQLRYVPQLFFVKHRGDLKVVAVKVVDDTLLIGNYEDVHKAINMISDTYVLGSIVSGPGTMMFFGMTIVKNNDYRVTIHGDNKLFAMEPYPTTRNRRKECTEPLDEIELSYFKSLNSSIGWMGIATSPFCSLASRYLQQKGPKPLVSDLVTQINLLRTLKKLGSSIHFKRSENTDPHNLSILVFCDASRYFEHGQLGYVAGLLIGPLHNGTALHVLSWSSHKSKRPVKSIGAAETLAAGAGIDEGKLLAKAYETLLHIDFSHIVAVDSKDLFSTLSTCRNAVDRSIRANVSVIRYEFETQHITRMLWIPGSTNLADQLTKPNSPLEHALQLLMFSG